MSTSKKVVNSFIWRLAERFGAQIVTFVVSVILARILDPEVYGLIALVTVFTSILQVFIDSGLGTALVQKKNADDLDFSSVFFFNILMCVCLYLLMFFGAPGIANFYKMPDLVPVIRVLSLILIISGIKNIQQAYVSRHLLFKRFFFSTLGGTIGAAIIGIYLAYEGYGVWALVAQYLFNSIVDTAILWITVKWRPKFMFSLDRLKKLLSFGWKLLGVSLLSTTYNDIRSLIIGKLYAPNDLAFYNRGQHFPQLISLNTDIAIDSVMLPVLSQRQDNLSDIKKLTIMSVRLGTYIIMPVMAWLAICSDSIISLLLTDKWLPCTPYLRIFCIVFAFSSVFTFYYNAFKSIGRSDVYLKVTVASKVFGLVILAATMWFGVIYIAYGLLINTIIDFFLCSYYSRKLISLPFVELFTEIIPNIYLSIITGIIIFAFNYIQLAPWLKLSVQTIIAFVVFILCSRLFNNKNYLYIKNNLIGLFNKKQ